jgi:hypothetical protein
MRPTHAILVLAAVLLGGCSVSEDAPVSAVSPSPSSPGDPEDLTRPLPDPLPDVVARVNGQPIHLAEVVPLLRDELRKYLPGQRAEKTPLTLRLALNRYIDQELLVQEALARGVVADTRAIEKDYDRARQDHPDDEEWRDHLASLGFDDQSFKAALRIRHTVQTMIAEASPIQPVSDEEARALFDKDPAAFAQPGAASPPPFEAVRKEAKARVQRKKQDDFMYGLARGLRARASIETFI